MATYEMSEEDRLAGELAERFSTVTGMPREWCKVETVIRCDGCSCIFHPDDEGEGGFFYPDRYEFVRSEPEPCNEPCPCHKIPRDIDTKNAVGLYWTELCEHCEERPKANVEGTDGTACELCARAMIGETTSEPTDPHPYHQDGETCTTHCA